MVWLSGNRRTYELALHLERFLAFWNNWWIRPEAIAPTRAKTLYRPPPEELFSEKNMKEKSERLFIFLKVKSIILPLHGINMWLHDNFDCIFGTICKSFKSSITLDTQNCLSFWSRKCNKSGTFHIFDFLTK